MNIIFPEIRDRRVLDHPVRRSVCDVAEPPAFAAGLYDLTMVRGPVEQGRRHLRVTENARTLPECEVRRHHDRPALVESADQMEQQQPAAQIER